MGIDNADVDEVSPQVALKILRDDILKDIDEWREALVERKFDVEHAEVHLAAAEERLVVFYKWAADHGVMLDTQILSEVI